MLKSRTESSLGVEHIDVSYRLWHRVLRKYNLARNTGNRVLGGSVDCRTTLLHNLQNMVRKSRSASSMLKIKLILLVNLSRSMFLVFCICIKFMLCYPRLELYWTFRSSFPLSRTVFGSDVYWRRWWSYRTFVISRLCPSPPQLKQKTALGEVRPPPRWVLSHHDREKRKEVVIVQSWRWPTIYDIGASTSAFTLRWRRSGRCSHGHRSCLGSKWPTSQCVGLLRSTAAIAGADKSGTSRRRIVGVTLLGNGTGPIYNGLEEVPIGEPGKGRGHFLSSRLLEFL